MRTVSRIRRQFGKISSFCCIDCALTVFEAFYRHRISSVIHGEVEVTLFTGGSVIPLARGGIGSQTHFYLTSNSKPMISELYVITP